MTFQHIPDPTLDMQTFHLVNGTVPELARQPAHKDNTKPFSRRRIVCKDNNKPLMSYPFP